MSATSAGRGIAVVLAATCVLLPLVTWLPGQPRADLQQGGWLTLAALAFLAWTAIARRRLPLAPGSALVGGALLLSLVPLLGQPWLQVQGALADRAPLASGWLLLGAARAWPGLAMPLVRVLATAAGAVLLLALVQAFGSVLPGGIAAPFADADAQAAFLLLVALAAATGLRGSDSGAPRPPRAAALVLLCAAAGWCGWLGLAAARVGVTLGLVVGWRRDALRPALAVLAGALFVVGELLRSIAPGSSSAPHDAAGEVRLAVHAGALSRVLEAPQGIGAGRWALDYPAWRPALEGEAAVAAGSASAPPPHGPRNELLLTLVEGGFGATLLLLTAAVLLLRRLSSAPTRTAVGDPLPMLAALAGFAALASPLAGAPPVLAAAALLAGAMRPLSGDADSTPLPGPRARHAATGVALAAALLAVLPAGAQIRGERAMAQALASGQADPEARLADAAEARPWDAQPWFLLAGVAQQLETWPQARALYRTALEVEPLHLGALTGAWMVEMLAPDGDQDYGFAMLERAEALGPWHPAVRGARPAWLRAVRDKHLEEARAMLAQGASARVRTLTCSAYLADARIALLQGDAAKARAALELAAPMSEGSTRLRIERMARDEALEASTVAALVTRLWPDWPDL